MCTAMCECMGRSMLMPLTHAKAVRLPQVSVALPALKLEGQAHMIACPV